MARYAVLVLQVSLEVLIASFSILCLICETTSGHPYLHYQPYMLFIQVFKVKAPQYFNDYHLIRSLIYKPTYSHFSRIERLTCVFVGLLAHMALCTAYYYSEVEVSCQPTDHSLL